MQFLKMTIGRKMLLLSFFIMAAILYQFKLAYDEKMISINFATKEVNGNHYIKELLPIYADVLKKRVDSRATTIDSASLSALNVAEQKFGASKHIKTGETLVGFKAALENIIKNNRASYEDMAAFMALLARVGDESNLILDPDLDSYYVMDLVLLKFADITNRMTQIILALKDLQNKGDMTEDQKITITVIKGQIISLSESITNSYDSIVRFSPDGSSRTALEPYYHDTKKSINKLLENTKVLFTLEKISPGDVGAYNAALDNIRTSHKTCEDNIFTFWEKSTVELDRLLSKRIDGFYKKMYFQVSIALLLIIMCLGIAVYLRLTLFRPLGHLTSVSEKLIHKEKVAYVPFTDRHDEIGHVAQTFENLRKFMDETFRQQQIIDDMPINIILADPSQEFSVFHINKHCRKDFIRLNIIGEEHDYIGDIFPQSTIDFHQCISNNKSMPRREVITLNNGRHAEKTVLQIMFNAIYNEMGEYIACMIAWTDITDKEHLVGRFEGSIGAVSQEIETSTENLESKWDSIQTSTGELSLAAREISDRIHGALNIVQSAVSMGEDARSHMTSLSNIAQEATSVVVLIHSIAEKTNLLALNATIESARAGDAGKGFAVVASEVKNLAGQTANAILEINQKITSMQDNAGSSFKMVEKICEVIKEINQISTDIASAVEEQQASTSEILRIIGNNKNPDMATSGSAANLIVKLKSTSKNLSKECNEFLDKMRGN